MSKPPSGADWVHEIKHDGYRMIVHRDGRTVRLYSCNAYRMIVHRDGRAVRLSSCNAYDWTERLAAIAAAAGRIMA